MSITFDVVHASHTATNGFLTLTHMASTTFAASRSTHTVNAGKWYWEIHIDAIDAARQTIIGAAVSNITQYPGQPSATSWGYYGNTGNKLSNGSSVAYGTTFTVGDVLGIALDMDNGRIFFAKNNTWQASGDPVAGTNPAFTGVTGDVKPVVGMYALNNAVTGRFLVADRTYTPPTGYTALDEAAPVLTEVLSGLVGEYGDVPVTYAALVGIYGLIMEQALIGRYGDSSQVQAALVGRYGDSSQVQAAIIGRYGDTLQVLAALEGRYHLMHSVLAGVEGQYAIAGAEVLAGLEGRYDLRERNEIAAALVGYYSLLPGASLQSITCPVLIGGVAVKWVAVQWTLSESSYLIEATISLRDGAEFGSISKNDQVTITWHGTVYTLFVASKLRSRLVSGSPGAVDYGVDYTIVARSLTAGLDEPYALPATLSWPAATMASAIATQLIAPLADIISLDWRLEDWLQPGGTFFLTDETPLAGLRKLAGIVGGILQTSPDNALIIRKADPVAPRDWTASVPTWTIEDSGLFSDSESEDISSLYNVITVTNQSATDSSIRFETEEIDRYRHRVKGYRVPWVDFTLATSGGEWVTIEDMGIIEEQVVETVEFIDGASSTTAPVYSAVSAAWLRSQLGAITGAEDGSLTAEVTGCSLAEITYTTRYHAWIGRSDRDEEVQFYAVELP